MSWSFNPFTGNFDKAGGGITWSTPVDSDITLDTDDLYLLASPTEKFADIHTHGLNQWFNLELSNDMPSYWGANLPAILIDGSNSDVQNAFGGAIIFDGNANDGALVIGTREGILADAGATTAAIFVATGLASGSQPTGDMVFQTGQSGSGATGNYEFYVGNTTGTKGSFRIINANVIDAGGSRIQNLTDPTSAQHAATKNYVDTADTAILNAITSSKSTAAPGSAWAFADNTYGNITSLSLAAGTWDVIGVLGIAANGGGPFLEYIDIGISTDATASSFSDDIYGDNHLLDSIHEDEVRILTVHYNFVLGSTTTIYLKSKVTTAANITLDTYKLFARKYKN